MNYAQRQSYLTQILRETGQAEQFTPDQMSHMVDLFGQELESRSPEERSSESVIRYSASMAIWRERTGQVSSSLRSAAA